MRGGCFPMGGLFLIFHKKSASKAPKTCDFAYFTSRWGLEPPPAPPPGYATGGKVTTVEPFFFFFQLSSLNRIDLSFGKNNAKNNVFLTIYTLLLVYLPKLYCGMKLKKVTRIAQLRRLAFLVDPPRSLVEPLFFFYSY